MPWIKLDDQWMDHPKIIQAGRDARDLWLASITWCAKHLTDGLFPENLLPVLATSAGVDIANVKQIAGKLVEVGLWDANENSGYFVHDYLDYNPSREQATGTSTARKEAGRRGGQQKASKMLANDVAKQEQNPAPSPSPSPSTDQTSSGGGDARPSIFKVYEREIGALTAMSGDFLKDALATYPEEWIQDAIREAARQNKRSWSYVDAILKRRKTEGTSVVDRQRRNGTTRVPTRNNGNGAPVRNEDLRKMAGLNDGEY